LVEVEVADWTLPRSLHSYRDSSPSLLVHVCHTSNVGSASLAVSAQAGYLQPSWAKKIVSFNESRRDERRDLHRPRHARTGPSASTVLPPPLLRQWKRRRPCRRTCWNRWRTGRGVGPSLPVTMTWQARYWLRMGADELLRMTMVGSPGVHAVGERLGFLPSRRPSRRTSCRVALAVQVLDRSLLRRLIRSDGLGRES